MRVGLLLQAVFTLCSLHGALAVFRMTGAYNAYAFQTKALDASPSTIEFWVKTDAIADTTRGGAIFSDYLTAAPYIAAEIHQYGRPRLFWNNGAPDVVFTAQDTRVNRWLHVAIVRDSTASLWRLYFDGQPIATNAAVMGTVSSMVNSRFWIGSDSRSGGLPFHGSIMELRVWSTIRSASEIAGNFDSRLAGGEPGLISYFRLNEATGPGITAMFQINVAKNCTFYAQRALDGTIFTLASLLQLAFNQVPLQALNVLSPIWRNSLATMTIVSPAGFIANSQLQFYSSQLIFQIVFSTSGVMQLTDGFSSGIYLQVFDVADVVDVGCLSTF
eukprot:TRINITY_DN2110_c0_g1_i12.p1 TRINITY_DN2110_c0_g1~~TRINITY_DN2110_c0_g1_i12.p1  ORF type:complete len:330 (-),score=32.09 TRINITY_DN2110_c0_g1_i12:195-1184(-)